MIIVLGRFIYKVLKKGNKTMNELSKDQLIKMNNERVWIQYDNLEFYVLVAYHADKDYCLLDEEKSDGDYVWLTNCLGGRSTYEEVIEGGGKIYKEKPVNYPRLKS